MILIDRRAGSAELQHLISTHHIPTELTTLDAGDFLFQGNGPKGPCLVGVERKRLRDALNSIRTGRLAGEQLPKLADYDFPYLFIEGVCRAHPDNGIMEEAGRGGWSAVRLGAQAFMYSELERFLTTIELRTPVRVRRTATAEMTVVCLVNLYHWFTDKEWDKHRAYCGIHNAPPHVMLFKPGLVQRVAAQLSGIGWDRSSKVASRFRSVVDLVAASKEDWMGVPGIGPVIAERVIKEICGLD